MPGFLNILIATSLFYSVHSQFLIPGPGITSRDGIEICGPVTSTITIIDNPMSPGVANALQSMILNNILDSTILNLPPESYGNVEFMGPCSFVIESVTYSPIIDTFYPTEYNPMFDNYPLALYTDPNIFLTEVLPPKIFYTETVTSFGPSILSPMSAPFDLIGYSDFYAPNLQILPISCINGYDVIPINSTPSHSIGLLDLILPPTIFGGFNDIYSSGVPCYVDIYE